MTTSPQPERLESLVKQRARELRGACLGYTDCIATLADELHRGERGKATRLGELGATPGMVAPLLQATGTADALFAKSKKAKAFAIGKIETLISAWVSDVYEERDPGAA